MKSNVDSLPNGNKKRRVHIKIKHNSISIKNFTYPFFVGFLDPRFEMHNVKGDPMTHSRFFSATYLDFVYDDKLLAKFFP